MIRLRMCLARPQRVIKQPIYARVGRQVETLDLAYPMLSQPGIVSPSANLGTRRAVYLVIPIWHDSTSSGVTRHATVVRM